MKAEKEMKIMELLELDPRIAEVLMNEGMHCVGCLAAHGETIGQACEVHGIDADRLIVKINKLLEDK